MFLFIKFSHYFNCWLLTLKAAEADNWFKKMNLRTPEAKTALKGQASVFVSLADYCSYWHTLTLRWDLTVGWWRIRFPFTVSGYPLICWDFHFIHIRGTLRQLPTRQLGELPGYYRTGSGTCILGIHPCQCPSPFPSPSISRYFPFTLLHLPLDFVLLRPSHLRRAIFDPSKWLA